MICCRLCRWCKTTRHQTLIRRTTRKVSFPLQLRREPLLTPSDRSRRVPRRSLYLARRIDQDALGVFPGQSRPLIRPFKPIVATSHIRPICESRKSGSSSAFPFPFRLAFSLLSSAFGLGEFLGPRLSLAGPFLTWFSSVSFRRFRFPSPF